MSHRATAVPDEVRMALDRGWSVIPLDEEKRPIIKTWKQYQTRRPSLGEVEAWARKRPAAWGVITGPLSGVVVLDFDGSDGPATLQQLNLTPNVQTPSGGFHRYAKHPGSSVPTLNCKKDAALRKSFPGMDIRGDGGYAAFCGKTAKGTYSWVRPLNGSIPDLPASVSEWIEQRARRQKQAPPRERQDARTGAEPQWLLGEALKRAPSEGRNNAGFWLALQLRDNRMSESAAEEIMAEYARRVGPQNTKGQSEPYTEAEALASLRQARGAPAREPLHRRAELPSAPPAVTSPETAISSVPPGFELRDSGVYKIVETKDRNTGEIKPEALFLCAPLDVIGLTRDSRNEGWGKLVRFRDPDHRLHEVILSEALLASQQGEWLAQLKCAGLFVHPANNVRGYIREYLFRAMPAARARKVDQIGWHGDVFVTPGWTVPSEVPERIVLDDQSEAKHYFGQRGDLSEWRASVSSLCRGNVLLQFAVSAAFAPILLPLRHGMGGGFHLAANSSTGKSTTLVVAGSVWGGGGKLGFAQSWNATANGLEAMAQAHNHCLLCLDELKELPADQAGRVAYELANGQGRARMDRTTKRSRQAFWDLVFLSTGEFGFIEHIEAGAARSAKARDRAYAGQEVRICEIPADRGRFGSFDTLHADADGGSFADRLVKAAKAAYGTAAPEFVRRFLAAGRECVRGRLEQLINDFMADTLDEADFAPEVRRALQRFAFVAAAGELATEWGLTGWEPDEANRAARTAFRYWLSARGTAGSFDEKRALDHVREAIRLYGQSRFQRHAGGQVSGDASRLPVCWGFTAEVAGDTEYQLTDLTRDFCGPFDKQTVLKALLKANALATEGDRHKAKRVLPPGKSVRCYVIRHSKLFPEEFEHED